jgi:DNA-directed RNA polymerase sigma subunit (sigma70/sigma32)
VGEEGETGLGDLLPSDELTPDEEVEIDLREQTVRSVLSQLPDLEREVVQLRYGLNGDKAPVSTAEVGRRLSLRPAEVTRIERDALADLAQRRELAALR